MRARIEVRRSMGFSLRVVAAAEKVSVSVVRRAIRPSPARRPPPPTAAQKRRNRKLRQFVRARVDRRGVAMPLYPSVRALSRALSVAGAPASRSTVWRLLRGWGMHARVRRPVPCLDPVNLDRRLKYCRYWLAQSLRARESIVWSDETWLSCADWGSRTQWCSPGEAPCRLRQAAYNVPRVQIWAAFGVGWRSPLVVFPQRETGEDAAPGTGWRLNSERYIKRCLARIVGDMKGRIYMQDGARCHTSAAVLRYLDRKQVKRINDHPPYSPDLNMAELAWVPFKRGVDAEGPRTLDELIAAAHKAWAAIPQTELNAIAKHFTNVLKRVVQNKGKP
jgi:hypothetical protein